MKPTTKALTFSLLLIRPDGLPIYAWHAVASAKADRSRPRDSVQEWMQYAEDKGTSSGSYVTLNDEGCYETG